MLFTPVLPDVSNVYWRPTDLDKNTPLDGKTVTLNYNHEQDDVDQWTLSTFQNTTARIHDNKHFNQCVLNSIN